jgi:hypothetical protein
MNVFDRLLAGERVTLYASGHSFEMTYGPAESPCFTTYHGQNAIKTSPLTADVARAHFDEQARRYGWSDENAPAPVAKVTPVKVEAAKVQVAPARAPTFEVEETPTERPKKTAPPKKKGK